MTKIGGWMQSRNKEENKLVKQENGKNILKSMGLGRVVVGWWHKSLFKWRNRVLNDGGGWWSNSNCQPLGLLLLSSLN